MNRKTAIVSGVTNTFVVFLLGFATMYLLWLRIGSPRGLPGLFYYRAATIGDGICLPILVGSSTIFIQYNRESHEAGNKISLVAVIVAVVIAAAIQASWLIRDDTVLNWSIPIQHHFNLAGWYHSLFFIMMFGVIAYQLSRMWLSMQKKQGTYTDLEKVVLILFVLSGSLFVFMFVSDNFKEHCTMPLLLTISAMLIFLLLMVFIRTANKGYCKDLTLAIIMGIVSAYSISLTICVPAKGEFAIALGGGLCACFLWRVESHSVKRLVCKDIWIMGTYAIMLYLLSGLNALKDQISILAFLIFLTLMVEKTCTHEFRSRSVSVILVVVYGFAINSPLMKMIRVELLDVVFVLIVYLLFKKEITGYFSEVITAEIAKNNRQLCDEQFKYTKVKAYLQIVIGILATAVLIARWLLEIALSKGNKIEAGTLNVSIDLVVLLMATILVLFLLGIKQVRKHIFAKVGAVSVSGFAFVLLIKIVLDNIDIQNVLVWSPLKWFMFFCTLFACIGAAILSAYGYYMNMVLLRGLRKKRAAFILAIMQLFGGLLLNLFLTDLILYRQTWKGLMLVVIISMIAFELLPVLHGRIIQYEHLTFHVVGNNAISGVAQDGLMICLIILFVIWMPCTYVSIINVTDPITILGGITLIGSAFPPIGYCLRNNAEHIKRQKEVVAKYPDEAPMWDILHKCLVRQSKQTIFSTFPYVLVASCTVLMKQLGSSKTPQEAIKNMINTYIDKEWEF